MLPMITPAMLFDVRDKMRAFVARFVTPISASDDLQNGTALGTGNYVRLGRSSYLLTNAHVAQKRAYNYHLAHLPIWNDHYRPIANPLAAEHWPIDVAIARLESDPPSSGRSVLPSNRLARHFAPVDREMLFWLGYPGSMAGRHDPVTASNARRSLFGLLHVPGVPVLTVAWEGQTPSLQAFDAKCHVILHYPATASESESALAVETPNPAGMSGSLLWDTKFIACYEAGIPWTPEKAEACGLGRHTTFLRSPWRQRSNASASR